MTVRNGSRNSSITHEDGLYRSLGRHWKTSMWFMFLASSSSLGHLYSLLQSKRLMFLWNTPVIFYSSRPFLKNSQHTTVVPWIQCDQYLRDKIRMQIGRFQEGSYGSTERLNLADFVNIKLDILTTVGFLKTGFDKLWPLCKFVPKHTGP